MINFFITDSTPYSDKAGASISTHTGMAFASDVFLLVESEGVGINGTNLNRMVNNYTVGTSIGFNHLNTFIFLFLGMYLDQIVPNEFG
jgi:hypothetical protein